MNSNPSNAEKFDSVSDQTTATTTHTNAINDSETAAKPRRRGRPRLGKAVARDLSRDEEILRIAAEVIWAKGFSGAKLGDIAAAAGIVKGSLYHYFDSKEEIYERLFRRVRTLSDFDGQGVPGSSARKRLDYFLQAHLNVSTSHPLEAALLARDMVRMQGTLGEWARSTPKRHAGTIRQLVIQGQKEGEFRATDPDAIAGVIMGILAHVPHWILEAQPSDPEAVAREMCEFVLAGLTNNPPTRD